MPSFDFPEIPASDMLTRVVTMGGASVPNAPRLVRQSVPPNEEVSTLKITVPGEPVPKGRPRARIVTPRGKKSFITFYQDAETAAYENRVAQEAFLVMRGRGLLLGALRIQVTAYLPVPKSWSIKKTQEALHDDLLPTSRPDADNFLKIIDALNLVVWKDDSQIVDMKVSKRYSDTPRLEIEIFPA